MGRRKRIGMAGERGATLVFALCLLVLILLLGVSAAQMALQGSALRAASATGRSLSRPQRRR